MPDPRPSERPDPTPLGVLRRPEPDPARLLEALREQRPGAAARLYDTYERDVNRLVWRLYGSASEHDDLVQQVFLAILRSVERVRDPEALSGWVRAITVNTVRSEIRKRRVRRIFFGAPLEDPDRFEGFADDVEGRDLLRRVYGIFDAMPADERIAFQLRHVEELPLPEAADATGCSLATFKRRLTRAETRFRALAQRDSFLRARLGSRFDRGAG